jgi:hypothetical protein
MGAKAELKMEATLEAASELGLKATVGLHVRLSGSESCTEIKGRTGFKVRFNLVDCGDLHYSTNVVVNVCLLFEDGGTEQTGYKG